MWLTFFLQFTQKEVLRHQPTFYLTRKGDWDLERLNNLPQILRCYLLIIVSCVFSCVFEAGDCIVKDPMIHLANIGWTLAMCKVLNEASAIKSTWIYNQKNWALTLRTSAYDTGQVSPPLCHGTWNPQERRPRIRNLSWEVLMNNHNITAVNSCSFRSLTLNCLPI